jgi:Ti-type conjugative transfer relaxase TraA
LADRNGERRYTTRELLALERGLLEGATARRGGAAGLAGGPANRTAVDARPTLTQEQRQLVRALTQSGDGVQVLRAAAGTGKTFAMGAAVEAWQRSGIAVLGCGLSARAACELRDQTGMDTTTIARLTFAFEQGAVLARGSILIVDEAGMVGTRDLAVLARAAEDARAKLVLIGDDRQLPEIQAGGAFRALAEHLGALELRDGRRQNERWDRDALAALRRGEVETFAAAYEAHGRLVVASTAGEARAAMVRAWCDAHAGGDTSLMIAHRRRDVAELNARARTQLRASARIGDDLVRTAERSFAAGDRVVTTHNDRSLGVVNGQAGTVAGLREGELEVRFDDGRWVRLPEPYMLAGHLDHGYALTAHRAQGATVDRAFVLGSDELYREWGYTALSRHRIEARFYVTATPRYLNEPPAPLEAGADVTGKVARMLGGSGAKTLAAGDVVAAHERRHVLDARLRALQNDHANTRRFRRARRAELERQIDACRRELREPLTSALPAIDRLSEPRPGRDPLAGLDHARQRGRQRGSGREL